MIKQDWPQPGLSVAEDLSTQIAAAAPVLSEMTTVGAFAAGEPPVRVAQAAPQPQIPGGALTAVGTIDLVRDRQVVLEASGRVDTVNVENGDVVQAGDVLVALDTTYLDWDVEQAELAFEAARIDFEEAGEAVDEGDIAVAEANLLLAQENLTEVAAGPTAENLTAAQSNAAAAWARYEELQAQPTETQIILAQVALRHAEIGVEAAQREYDKIGWLPEAAASSAADSLQSATIELEAAKANYTEAMKPATEAELQSALASAQSAQASLNELEKQPTPAQLADAEAQVTAAETSLAKLMEGPEQAAVRKAELDMRNAMINLEAARLALENAQVKAPIDGTVLEVNVDVGQQASAGSVVARLADTADVKLTVNVEQRDIAGIQPGQAVAIAIYALAADTFFGVVDQIAPVADAGTGFVTFPVIIRFTDGPMEKVLPGMTASATFIADDDGAATSGAAPAVAETPAATETPTQAPTTAATAAPETEAVATATPLPEDEATPTPAAEPEATATPGK